MSSLQRLEDVRSTHKLLYDMLLQDQGSGHKIFNDPTERNDFELRVDKLLADVQLCAPQIKELSDYTWLINITLQWQIAFSTLLEKPKYVKIPRPSEHLEAPVTRMSEEDIENWIASNAKIIGCFRLSMEARKMIERLSSKEDRDADWFHAHIYFCSEVLAGTLDVVRIFPASALPRLENVWLRDVIQLKAYLIWEERSKGRLEYDPTGARNDYIRGCNFYRERLVDQSIKLGQADAVPIRDYLLSKYFATSGGNLDDNRIKPLIEKKAAQFVSAGKGYDHNKNWEDAQAFVKNFYGGIIRAIESGDQRSKDQVREAILLSEGNRRSNGRISRLSIMDCFEAAIAIYFVRGLEFSEDDWKQ